MHLLHKPVYILLLILIGSFSEHVFSQMSPAGYYWVKFKDKQNNSYSLTNPQQFLLQRSIDRRANQGLSLDSTDLPISQAYIDSIAPYITNLVHRLKWFNMVVVQIGDSTFPDSIKRFAFVDSVAPISSFPFQYYALRNKLETVTQVDQNIIYPNVHGAAYHQLNMISDDLLYQMGYKGQGILIAMMDNGLLNADTVSAFDSVRPRIIGTWDFVHNIPSVYTDPLGGHALYTFSCIAANLPYTFVGAAPEADFCLFQTEDNDAEWVMEEYHWAAGAEMADSFGAQIFSTSLGYTTFNYDSADNTYADLTGNKTVIAQACNIAASKGIIVFNAAGNDGGDSWHYVGTPGDADSAITVGAVDSTRTIAAFSSWGPNASGRIKPDLCAEGRASGIISTNGTPTLGYGTSFATPTAAGATASLWSAFPDKTAKEIQTAVMVSCDRFWNPNNQYGYGIPNFYTAYLLLKTGYNGNILKISSNVTAYPNPFSDQLNIAAYDSAGNYHTIDIYDLTGRKVYENTFYIRTNSFDVQQLPVQGLAAGEYVLEYDHKKQYSQKLIKAR